MSNNTTKIYQEDFTPTWLYIKQHTVTGLLYFGKTTQDVNTYLGSGKYWATHFKKHGKEHIVTLWCELFYSKEEIKKFASEFSKSMNIVKSASWANLKEENGLDGGWPLLSDETRKSINKKNTGKKRSQKVKDEMSKNRIGKRTHWDKTIYILQNRYTQDIFQGTRIQFIDYTNLSSNMIDKLVAERTFSTSNGWKLYDTPINPNPIFLDITKQRWYNDGLKVYSFYPDDYRTINLMSGKIVDGNKNPNAKTFKLVDPNGKVYDVSGNLINFCKETSLKHYQILDVLNNKRDNSNGWTAFRI